jgi:transposase
MKVNTRNRYTAEFKAQVLELVELGKSVTEVAQDFEISSDLVYRWRRTRPQLPQLGSGGKGAEGDRAGADELRELRRQLTHLQLENDILKKAAIILGTNPPPKREL